MPTPTIKLTYFNGRGAAEATRLALTIGGFEFEDVRLTGEEFVAEKPNLPLGSLPVMEFNGKKYVQSGGMLRAAGVLAGLYSMDSMDPMEILAVEAVLGTVDDFYTALTPLMTEDNAEKKLEMLNAFREGPFLRYLGGMETFLGDKYAAGGRNLTIADLEIYCMVVALRTGFVDGISSDCIDQFPKMSAIAKLVDELPEVQRWNEAHK